MRGVASVNNHPRHLNCETLCEVSVCAVGAYSAERAALFQGAAQSLTTSRNQDAMRFYSCTVRNFLNFLDAQYPQVQSLHQLRRDPHILA